MMIDRSNVKGLFGYSSGLFPASDPIATQQKTFANKGGCVYAKPRTVASDRGAAEYAEPLIIRLWQILRASQNALKVQNSLPE
jgi:hypothetical protein